MYYKQEQREHGDYVGPDGHRVMLLMSQGVIGDKSGWTIFDSTADCIAAWGLSYHPISEEEMGE